MTTTRLAQEEGRGSKGGARPQPALAAGGKAAGEEQAPAAVQQRVAGLAAVCSNSGTAAGGATLGGRGHQLHTRGAATLPWPIWSEAIYAERASQGKLSSHLAQHSAARRSGPLRLAHQSCPRTAPPAHPATPAGGTGRPPHPAWSSHRARGRQQGLSAAGQQRSRALLACRATVQLSFLLVPTKSVLAPSSSTCTCVPQRQPG